jgi:8-oxo-dGTP diphosphatase
MLRAVFYEEDDARAVTAGLRRDGFQATVSLDRLAGEDDDQDHPWAVVTDAPEFVVEVLVDAHDGWLDADALGDPSPSAMAAPFELPDAPRRVKGHFTGGPPGKPPPAGKPPPEPPAGPPPARG